MYIARSFRSFRTGRVALLLRYSQNHLVVVQAPAFVLKATWPERSRETRTICRSIPLVLGVMMNDDDNVMFGSSLRCAKHIQGILAEEPLLLICNFSMRSSNSSVRDSL